MASRIALGWRRCWPERLATGHRAASQPREGRYQLANGMGAMLDADDVWDVMNG